jgi:uncharacterized protein (DUF952 family)
MTIFHIALRSDWELAKRQGSYRVSTRGKSLDEVGFVHCSWQHQVSTIANSVYADVTHPLCLLVIDESRLSAPVHEEDIEGTGQSFPHIYGPVDLDAVVEVREYVKGSDGRYPSP